MSSNSVSREHVPYIVKDVTIVNNIRIFNVGTPQLPIERVCLRRTTAAHVPEALQIVQAARKMGVGVESMVTLVKVFDESAMHQNLFRGIVF